MYIRVDSSFFLLLHWSGRLTVRTKPNCLPKQTAAIVSLSDGLKTSGPTLKKTNGLCILLKYEIKLPCRSEMVAD